MNTIQIPLSLWKEGNVYVSFTPALDLSSCGDTKDDALKNISEAAALFFQTAEERDCLQELLEDFGWTLSDVGQWIAPSELLTDELYLDVNVPLPLAV
ncbi:hypothetical protein FACS1894170_11050 [Planctomycetales bacterium]|nr:hypothetical protein FACS1894170_11050 [Planctomycetales bacterium]